MKKMMIILQGDAPFFNHRIMNPHDVMLWIISYFHVIYPHDIHTKIGPSYSSYKNFPIYKMYNSIETTSYI